MTISTVAPTANSSGAASLSDTGIGSGLDVSSIVSKLMQVESQPVTALNNQISAYQATLSAYGQVTSALSSFQTSIQALNSAAGTITLGVTASNSAILSGSTSTGALPNTYNVNVTQLAQAQSLATSGVASTSATIGSGTSTTISFQFGTIGNGVTGTTLNPSIASSGIDPGELTINGTAINTGSTTTSASALAAQINQETATTGVTATATAASTGTIAFTPITTGVGDKYNLTVGGVSVANVAASSTFSAANLDSALQTTGTGSVGAQLKAAGITFTGTAAAGTLRFQTADGANLTLSQALTNTSGTASGGISGVDNTGALQTYMGGVTLSSSSAVTIGGTNPDDAGFTAGSFNNSTYTQNSSSPGGTVTIDSSDSSLQGIASAINAANVGVTASIINDGTSTPYRLVLTSNATGAASSMKISVTGDATVSNMLTEDPTGTQDLTQSVAAQNTNLTVNGIPITSQNNTITGAIQGVTLNVAQTGTTSVTVAQNTSTLQSAVSSFVTAYNSLNSLFTAATSHTATSNGPLIGDSGVLTVQAGIRAMLGGVISGASQNLNSLQQVGITFQNDGSMQLNTGTLQNAITSNANGVATLFGALGNTSDSQVSYTKATSATQAGTYAVNITQLATQGSEVGSAAPNLTITSGSNDGLDVTIDGVQASLTIPSGNYTASSLAAEVQSLVNGSSTISAAGSGVLVTVNSSGALAITSKRYGSASQVTLGGNALGSLLGSSPTSAMGLDVQGTIGGYGASGSGQVLTGLAGSPTAGLALTVTGSTTGARGTVTYSEGYANQLNSLLTTYLGSSGPISNETSGINNTISSLQAQVTALNQTLAAQQANYLAEFQALDTTISSLDATQTYLTQELASLAANA